MRPVDNTRFALGAATGNRLRTVLLMLAMSIGVAAVVVLTALGDGARRYVINEFSALGTDLVIVLPGRTQTGGFATERDHRHATQPDDRRAIAVRRATAARLSRADRGRHVRDQRRRAPCASRWSSAPSPTTTRCATSDGEGRFCRRDWTRGSPVIVLGAKVREDVFGRDARARPSSSVSATGASA